MYVTRMLSVNPICSNKSCTDQKQMVSCEAASFYLSNDPLFTSRVNDLYTQVCRLKEDEFIHVVKENQGALIGKIGGKWIAEPIVDHARGSLAQVKLTNSLALRILSGSSSRQEEFLRKERTFLERTNLGGVTIGINPSSLGFMKKVYDITTGELKKYPVEYKINKRFQGDLLKSSFSVEGIPTLCAHVALGLKALHESNHHHLDIKPANILYEGNGSAYLSDLNGCFLK